MTKYDPEKVESVKLKRGCRVLEDGAKEAKAFKPGETVKVSGNSKSQLLASGFGELVSEEKKK